MLRLNTFTASYCPDGDFASVEVSSDGGFVWTELTRWTAVDYSTWSVVLLNLAPYVGLKIKLRFTLRDTGCTSNCGLCVNDGWYIDDLEIREV
jgi:hypothetical protein